LSVHGLAEDVEKATTDYGADDGPQRSIQSESQYARSRGRTSFEDPKKDVWSATSARHLPNVMLRDIWNQAFRAKILSTIRFFLESRGSAVG
jgi:hypothetical protein